VTFGITPFTLNDTALFNSCKLLVVTLYYHLVDTEQQLRAIGKDSGSLSLNYMLNRDISLTGEWVSIGDSGNPFTGTFNGNGFEIKGLKMTDPAAQFIGLFGYAKGATIYNVTLRDVDIERAGGTGKHVGAICAMAESCNIYDNQVIVSENNVVSASQPDKNTVFHLSNGSGRSITQSSSFEAKAGQTLTITAESSIKGGTVDFFLFSSAGNGFNEVTTFTFGGSNATKTVELTAGRWAYNCTGFFDSGDIVITGTIKDTASVGALTSQADRSDTEKYDAEAIRIMENSGTWNDSINRLLPYMSPGGVEKVVNIYLERHLFPNITPPEAARQVASTIESALKYMTKAAVESAEGKIAAYY